MTQTQPTEEDVSRPASPAAPPPDLAPPTRHGGVRRLGDRVFSGAATAAGVVILVVLALVAAFLVVQGLPALTAPADDLPYGAVPALRRCRWSSAPSGRRSWP